MGEASNLRISKSAVEADSNPLNKKNPHGVVLPSTLRVFKTNARSKRESKEVKTSSLSMQLSRRSMKQWQSTTSYNLNNSYDITDAGFSLLKLKLKERVKQPQKSQLFLPLGERTDHKILPLK